MAETMLVRIKPLAPKNRCVLQRYTAFSIRFDVERGWYRVPKHIADYLATVKQIDGDPTSPDAFDVCTEAEARAIEERDKRAKRRLAEADDPNETAYDPIAGVVTTKDLAGRAAAAAPVAAPAPVDAPEEPKIPAAAATKRGPGRPRTKPAVDA